jgi:VanZ family protein
MTASLDREPALRTAAAHAGHPRALGARALRVLEWALLVVWAAGVWWLSDQSDPHAATGIRLRLPDKVAHVLLFAAGGFFARGAFRTSKRVPATLAAGVVCAAYGVADEVHQAYVPGRHADGMDVAADVAGAVAGALLHAALWGGWRRRPGRDASERGPRRTEQKDEVTG